MSGLQHEWCGVCNAFTYSPIHHEHKDDDRRKQVGGDHYASHEIQPWDIIDEYELNYYEGNVLKYLLRRKDNRLQDMRKIQHYVEKMIQAEEAK